MLILAYAYARMDTHTQTNTNRKIICPFFGYVIAIRRVTFI